MSNDHYGQGRSDEHSARRAPYGYSDSSDTAFEYQRGRRHARDWKNLFAVNLPAGRASGSPLGQRGRLILLIVIIGVALLFMQLPGKQDAAKRRAKINDTFASLNLRAIRASEVYRRHRRQNLNDSQAILATEAAFIRYVDADVRGANDLAVVRSYCTGSSDCESQDVEALAAATAYKLGGVMVQECNDPNHQTDLCRNLPAGMPSLGGGRT